MPIKARPQIKAQKPYDEKPRHGRFLVFKQPWLSSYFLNNAVSWDLVVSAQKTIKMYSVVILPKTMMSENQPFAPQSNIGIIICGRLLFT